MGAVRSGDWKLLEYYEDNRVELYNLKDDVGETTNLANQQVDVSSQLQKQLHGWRKEVSANEPSLNPNFKPRRGAK